jgi:hypothetical protein
MMRNNSFKLKNVLYRNLLQFIHNAPNEQKLTENTTIRQILNKFDQSASEADTSVELPQEGTDLFELETAALTRLQHEESIKGSPNQSYQSANLGYLATLMHDINHRHSNLAAATLQVGAAPSSSLPSAAAAAAAAHQGGGGGTAAIPAAAVSSSGGGAGGSAAAAAGGDGPSGVDEQLEILEEDFPRFKTGNERNGALTRYQAIFPGHTPGDINAYFEALEGKNPDTMDPVKLRATITPDSTDKWKLEVELLHGSTLDRLLIKKALLENNGSRLNDDDTQQETDLKNQLFNYLEEHIPKPPEPYPWPEDGDLPAADYLQDLDRFDYFSEEIKRLESKLGSSLGGAQGAKDGAEISPRGSDAAATKEGNAYDEAYKNIRAKLKVFPPEGKIATVKLEGGAAITIKDGLSPETSLPTTLEGDGNNYDSPGVAEIEAAFESINALNEIPQDVIDPHLKDLPIEEFKTAKKGHITALYDSFQIATLLNGHPNLLKKLRKNPEQWMWEPSDGITQVSSLLAPKEQGALIVAAAYEQSSPNNPMESFESTNPQDSSSILGSLNNKKSVESMIGMLSACQALGAPLPETIRIHEYNAQGADSTQELVDSNSKASYIKNIMQNVVLANRQGKWKCYQSKKDALKLCQDLVIVAIQAQVRKNLQETYPNLSPDQLRQQTIIETDKKLQILVKPQGDQTDEEKLVYNETLQGTAEIQTLTNEMSDDDCNSLFKGETITTRFPKKKTSDEPSIADRYYNNLERENTALPPEVGVPHIKHHAPLRIIPRVGAANVTAMTHTGSALIAVNFDFESRAAVDEYASFEPDAQKLEDRANLCTADDIKEFVAIEQELNRRKIPTGILGSKKAINLPWSDNTSLSDIAGEVDAGSTPSKDNKEILVRRQMHRQHLLKEYLAAPDTPAKLKKAARKILKKSGVAHTHSTESEVNRIAVDIIKTYAREHGLPLEDIQEAISTLSTFVTAVAAAIDPIQIAIETITANFPFGDEETKNADSINDLKPAEEDVDARFVADFPDGITTEQLQELCRNEGEINNNLLYRVEDHEEGDLTAESADLRAEVEHAGAGEYENIAKRLLSRQMHREAIVTADLITPARLTKIKADAQRILQEYTLTPPNDATIHRVAEDLIEAYGKKYGLSADKIEEAKIKYNEGNPPAHTTSAGMSGSN